MVKIETDKPLCPICGAEAYQENISWGHSLISGEGLAATKLYVYCQHCGLQITLEGYDVIGKWNKHLKIEQPQEPAQEAKKEQDGQKSNLDIAKQIIRQHFTSGECGIFSCRNTTGDPMEPLYDNGQLKIDICYRYEYFEVFGLSDAEFEELKKYYSAQYEGG